jgi:ubiquinol-cytochrome c reductase iron-sulfur subunit
LAGKDLEKGSEAAGFEHEFESGLAVIPPDKIKDPGLEPHRVRMTDKSPAKAKNAEIQVAALFMVSVVGSFFALWAYVAFPITEDLTTVRANNLFLGLGMTLSLLGIGIINI